MKNRWLVLCAVVGFVSVGQAAPEGDLHKRVATARDRAVAYLKSKQKNGHWEQLVAGVGQNRGGVTALVVLALIESGVKADDPAVQAGLAYLAKLPPEYTYTVALQTLCFCKGDPSKHAALIERNVKWLVSKARKGAQGFRGWGYPTEGANLPIAIDTDNSNSHFAVEALVTAARSGTKIDADFWRDVQEYYVQSQLASGGWSYHSGLNGMAGGERQTMTAAGIGCLAQVQSIMPAGAATDKAALDKAIDRLGETIRLTGGERTLSYQYYLLVAIKKAGTEAKRKTFDRVGVQLDWYREGAEWLLKNQHESGEWSGPNVDGIDVIATSMALRFLAS